jgi:hypothetical protein
VRVSIRADVGQFGTQRRSLVNTPHGQDVPAKLDDQIALLNAEIEPLLDELARLKKTRATLTGESPAPRMQGATDESGLSPPRLG